MFKTIYIRIAVMGFVMLGTLFSGVVLQIMFAHAESNANLSESVEPFRKVKVVIPPAILVPTVVELPLNTNTQERNDVAILDTTTNSFVPYYLRTTYRTNPEVLTAFTDRGGSAALVDQSALTSLEFPVVEEVRNIAEIVLTSVNPVESSSLILELDRYVALPTTVRIKAVTDGEQERLVVASRNVTGSTITFPKTTATRWIITFEYAQPLRINELRLVQDIPELTLSRSVRFLAQPNTVYKMYHDSDRATHIQTSEAGNLRDDSGVLALPVAVSTNNEWYRQADIDGDGVVDTMDNCVRIANTDQIDIDHNGRGDACDDFDRDGIMQYQDNCPNTPNARQADEDGDGIGDECDTEENRITEKYPWVPWAGMGIAVLVLGVLFVLVGTSPRNSEEHPM